MSPPARAAGGGFCAAAAGAGRGARCLLLGEPAAVLHPAHPHGLLLAAPAVVAAPRAIGFVAVLRDPSLGALQAERVLLLHPGRVHKLPTELPMPSSKTGPAPSVIAPASSAA